jgi:hypothetical protein
MVSRLNSWTIQRLTKRAIEVTRPRIVRKFCGTMNPTAALLEVDDEGVLVVPVPVVVGAEEMVPVLVLVWEVEEVDGVEVVGVEVEVGARGELEVEVEVEAVTPGVVTEVSPWVGVWRSADDVAFWPISWPLHVAFPDASWPQVSPDASKSIKRCTISLCHRYVRQQNGKSAHSTREGSAQPVKPGGNEHWFRNVVEFIYLHTVVLPRNILWRHL